MHGSGDAGSGASGVAAEAAEAADSASIAKCPLAQTNQTASVVSAMDPAAAREALLKMPKDERLATLEAMAADPKLLDVSTKPNTAVFYSGRVQTADGYVSARSLAESAAAHGKTTLEQTPGGKFLDKLDIYKGLDLSPDEADAVWRTLSKRYANGATGDVVVYQGEMRPGAILPDELKELAAKQAAGVVKEIKIIDFTKIPK